MADEDNLLPPGIAPDEGGDQRIPQGAQASDATVDPRITQILAGQPRPVVNTQSAPITGQLTPPDPNAIQPAVQFPPSAQKYIDQLDQQQTQVPKPTSGYGMPALITMIGQMIHPHSVNPMLRPPTRLESFENFLANFSASLGAGMAASGTGPGANIRGAAAALNQPHAALMQQYELQQQRQEQQARVAQQQAQAEQLQAETKAIPQRLEYEHQIALANLGLRQAQEQFNNLYKQQMLNLNAGKFDLAKQKEQFEEANKTWATQLKAKRDEAMAGNIKSQIQYRVDSMAERRYMDSQVTQLRRESNQLRLQGLNQQADAIDLQAASITNRIGFMDTLESDMGLRKIVQPTPPSRNRIPPAPAAPSQRNAQPGAPATASGYLNKFKQPQAQGAQ